MPMASSVKTLIIVTAFLPILATGQKSSPLKEKVQSIYSDILKSINALNTKMDKIVEENAVYQKVFKEEVLRLRQTIQEVEDPSYSRCSGTNCRGGQWCKAGTKCLTAIESENWEGARKKCQEMGGDLAVNPGVWIVPTIARQGLCTESVWLGASNMNGKWKWLKTEEVIDTLDPRWFEGSQHDSQNASNKCIIMISCNYFATQSCDEKATGLCEMSYE